MKKTAYWGVILIIAAVVVAVVLIRPHGPKTSGEVLVNVGNIAITSQDFKREWQKQNLVQGGSPPAGVDQFLKEMIAEKLFLLEARRQNIDRDPRFRQEVDNFSEQLLVEAVLNRQVLSVPQPDPTEVEEYWKSHQADFDVPELIRVSDILLKPKEGEGESQTRERAEAAVKKLKEGADFNALAEEISGGGVSWRGPDLGYFRPGQLPPELEDVAWKLAVGEVGGPIKTQAGYHLVKVTDRKAPRQKTLAEAQEDIISVILARRRKEKFDALEDKLRASTPIQINQEAANRLKSELEKKP